MGKHMRTFIAGLADTSLGGCVSFSEPVQTAPDTYSPWMLVAACRAVASY